MLPLRIKDVLPRRLYARALLILVVPIVAIQAVVTVIFIQRHFAGVTEQMSNGVALELLYAVATVEAAANPAEAQAELDRLAVPLGLFLFLEPAGVVTPGTKRRFYDLSGAALAATLARRIGRPLAVDLASDDKVAFARIQTDRGTLRAEIPRRRVIASNPHLLLVWMLATSGVLTFIAVLFLRNQVRPIRELAQAAEAFGKGRTLRFRPAGAEEVRQAGAAFLAMRARIERQVEQRTRMLTGISHDLRTPLTRIRLALAMMEQGPETEEIARDAREMEAMLDGFLAFVRGEGGEAALPVDAAELAAEIVGDARRGGREVGFVREGDPGASAEATLRRSAVKRAVQNLVENALAHGRTVRLTLRLLPRQVEFAVEDDGPGIPPAAREEAMRPFVRLDEARNQDRGAGVGLGLAIARDIAQGHGGTLDLSESAALGGLRAVIRLPR